MNELRPPPPEVVARALRGALAEDLGEIGDLTTEAIIPPDAAARAALVARRPGRVAGLAIALEAFRLVDPRVTTAIHLGDGCDAEAGTVLATVAGPARAILTAERTALNLLGKLSGIATATAGLVAAVAGTRARIACTRKTTPGLRALEKYAVRAGGGVNHRFGLYDGVLIKDNHIALAGGIAEAVRRARSHVPHLTKIEVEVDSLSQLEELLAIGADAVLLDNMSAEELRRAVDMVGGRMLTEASGGITLETAARVAATGVDLVSVGWITHSAPALDVTLEAKRGA